MVKRYEFTCHDSDPDAVIINHGRYVLYSDYAELEAENERLRNMLNGYGKLDAELAIAERRIEAISRTGAVKVKALEWEKCQPGVYISSSHSAKTEIGEYLAQSRAVYFRGNLIASASGLDAAKAAAQADYERRILSALTTEPAAPEGQQPVAWGLFYRGKIVAVSLHEHYRYTVPLYTHPSEQAVTDAMVEAAVQAVRQYTRDTLFIDEHRELVRTALKAAMEAGG